MTEYHLVTSEHRDRGYLEELAYNMFSNIDSALSNAIEEDWDNTALCLVAALQSANELRAVLKQEDNE